MSIPRTQYLVSAEMMALRQTLSMLNGFLWTTELSYGYVLLDPVGDFKDGQRKTRAVLGQVEATQAWYPTRHGQDRFNDDVSVFLTQVKGNTRFIYRAVIVFIAASFEEYLKKRVGDQREKTGGSGWGPYVVSLSCHCMKTSGGDVHLQTLLCADFCREIRNLIAHEPNAPLPTSLDQKKVAEWAKQLRSKNAQLADRLTPALITGAAKHFYDEAVSNIRGARKRGRELPVEYFYMLFTLANLDKLAFELELALPPASEMFPLEQKPRRRLSDQSGKGPIVT